MNQSIQRALPASLNTERAILGAILLDGSLFSQTADDLKPGDFCLDAHRRIYTRMYELMAADSRIDIITLTEELGRHEEIEVIGGFAYISSLIDGVPERPSIAHYVRIVRDKATLRRLADGLEGVIEQA